MGTDLPSQTHMELGGRAFELIEFSLDRCGRDGSVTTGRYGVNVAKVREVVRLPPINPLASSIPGVAGVFELRGIPIPAINLAVALGDREGPLNANQQIIVTEFSLKRAGFIVKATKRIRRIEWEKVLPPTTDKHSCINGMTLVENNEFLFILDLERILIDIESKADTGFAYDKVHTQPTEVETQLGFLESQPLVKAQPGTALHILLVDDSELILNNVKIFLQRAGYRVTTASNGLQAKKLLEAYVSQKMPSSAIDVIVTDIEMPKMDGLSLTRWIKGHTTLKSMPVVLHTSISGPAVMQAGSLVGANAYVIKNDVNTLLNLLKDFAHGPLVSS